MAAVGDDRKQDVVARLRPASALLDRLDAPREVPLIGPERLARRGRDQLALPAADAGQGEALTQILEASSFRAIEPLGYLAMLSLIESARMVLTDSGGIQEETTVLGVPCLTLRNNTERPITCAQGTNRLVGLDQERIVAAGREVLAAPRGGGRVPELWDGRAAGRIVEVLTRG